MWLSRSHSSSVRTVSYNFLDGSMFKDDVHQVDRPVCFDSMHCVYSKNKRPERHFLLVRHDTCTLATAGQKPSRSLHATSNRLRLCSPVGQPVPATRLRKKLLIFQCLQRTLRFSHALDTCAYTSYLNKTRSWRTQAINSRLRGRPGVYRE